MSACPICDSKRTTDWGVVDSYPYFQCRSCTSIYIEPSVMQAMDAGQPVVEYSTDYWVMERTAARERSFGSSLARVAEVILYARRPIRRFLDIGSGPGFLLDALATYLPASQSTFFGVEMFPPAEHSLHPNYVVGSVGTMEGVFEAGCCIEVIEHLTPSMLDALFSQLASVSTQGSLFLFNTALPEFVNNEDRGYLDPKRRGHIVSYGLPALSDMAGRHGFRLLPLRGKSWAFCLEYGEPLSRDAPEDRIWSALPENRQLLFDPQMGSAMYILGLESARAYR